MKTENAELQIIDSKEFGIEEKKAKEITSGLTTILHEREILQESYHLVTKLEIVPENIAQFKELRLKIRDNRTKGIEAWHKVNKDFYLKGGQFVDAIKRKEVLVNELMEEKLLEAEKHFENLEIKRLSDLNQSRKDAIAPYVTDLGNMDFSNMPEDVWSPYFESKKNAYAEQVAAAKIEAERIEKERVEKEKEIEKQRLENIRLKKEADAKEAELQKERAEAKAKADKIEAELTKEREEAKVKADKLQAEADAKLQKEREAREKLEAEIKQKKDAEIKAEADKAKAEEAAKKEADKLAKAPVKKQLSVWVNEFAIPESPMTENETAKSIAQKFESFKAWAITEIEKL